MNNDTGEVCTKMVDALCKSRGHIYAVGYIESFLAGVINRYVTDERELTLLKIEMLGISCNQLLDKMERV
jgi:hypothetical protein